MKRGLDMEHEVKCLKNIDVVYDGDCILIGRDKRTDKTYYRPKTCNIPDLWFRFELAYFEDYSNFVKGLVCNSCSETHTEVMNVLPDLEFSKDLTKDTLDMYKSMFQPDEIFINNICYYSMYTDTQQTLEQYCSDMHNIMIPHNYFPRIKEVNLKLNENGKFNLNFVVVIEFGG